MGQTTSKSAGDGKPKPKTTSAAAAAAAVVSETATGSMTMRIAGYSQTKGIGVGNSINSSKFHAGGHTWYIAYYPDGDREEYSDWVSVYLCLARPAGAAAADDVVEAKFTLSLLSGTYGAVVEEKICTAKEILLRQWLLAKLGAYKIHQEEEDGQSIVVVSTSRRSKFLYQM